MQNVNEQIMEAMKSGASQKLSVLRAFKAALINLSCQKGRGNKPITEEEAWGVLRKMLKQRQESAEMFLAGGRPELAAKENEEAEIISSMLPAPLSDSELSYLVMKAISVSGAMSRRETGKAMKFAVELAQGRADNKRLSMEIQRQLPE